MTFVVGKDCINCKHTTCVQVCPVDCFYEGKNILVIDPEECIDCGLCEPECPVDAIFAEDEVPADQLDILVHITHNRCIPLDLSQEYFCDRSRGMHRLWVM